MNRIREIHLWADGSRHTDDLDGLHAWLGGRLPDTEAIVEGDVWARVPPEERVPFAARVAGGRVFELHAPLPPGGNDPLPGETAHEERRIRGETSAVGILYDGFHFSSVLRSIPGPGGGTLRALHVVLTDRLVGTFDRNDRRYHARVAVFGYPHIISTTGVVVAPARPREYYLIRRRYRDAGMVPPEIDETLRERYLDHGDPRIAEALKGCLLQCLFYQSTGEPFCPEPGCRLFNAHWQEELIFAQVSSVGGLCAAHEELLASIVGAGASRGGTDAR